MQDKIRLDEALELLRSAEINCDNVARVGSLMIKVVKSQIQEAIKALGHEPATDPS